MAARRWTKEQRERHSKVIHDWQPWQHSTGPKSQAGKAKVAMNGERGRWEARKRFSSWLLRHKDEPMTIQLARQGAVMAKKAGQPTEHWLAIAKELEDRLEDWLSDI